jgi:hypothetical protein
MLAAVGHDFSLCVELIFRTFPCMALMFRTSSPCMTYLQDFFSLYDISSGLLLPV